MSSRAKSYRHYLDSFTTSRAWKAAHPPQSAPKIEKKPVQYFELTVSTDEFTAVAQWDSSFGICSCIAADKPIRWMVGMSQHEAKLALLRMDAKWIWKRLGQPEQVQSGEVRGEPRVPNVMGSAHRSPA